MTLHNAGQGEIPFVEVDYFSKDPDFRDKIEDLLASQGNRIFGDRYWVFRRELQGYKAAVAVSKLVVGATLLEPDLRPYNIGAVPMMGRRTTRDEAPRDVAHLALIAPRIVGMTPETEEVAVDRIINAVNDDLYGLGSFHELPHHPLPPLE